MLAGSTNVIVESECPSRFPLYGLLKITYRDGLDTEDTRMEEAKALGIRTFQYGRLPAFLLLPLPNHLPPFISEDQNMLLHNVNIGFISTLTTNLKWPL